MTKKLNNPNSGATFDEYELKNATIQAFTKPASTQEATYQNDEIEQLAIMTQKLSLMTQLQNAFAASPLSTSFDLIVANLTLQLNDLEVQMKQLQVRLWFNLYRKEPEKNGSHS